MRRALSLVSAGLFVLLATATSLAKEASPTEWPLDRIITNLEAKVREAPNYGFAHYNLGRAHAFAFALKSSALWGYREDALLDVKERERLPSSGAPLDENTLLAHLAEGIRHLCLANELGPEHEEYHLTFAWLCEIGASSAERIDTASAFHLGVDGLPADELARLERLVTELGSREEGAANSARSTLLQPENLEHAVPLLCRELSSNDERPRRVATDLVRQYWIERAIASYWRAFDIAISSDLSKDRVIFKVGTDLHDLVSSEALDGYRRLVEQRGATVAERKNLVMAAEKFQQLSAKPRGAFITPVLVTFQGCASLDELVTPDLAVPFDLDGDYVDELWPWLAPGTGWLVWDPKHRGEITSGRQLFGSASGWLFFEDGYRVLDALDDDRDGELRGPELAGIAVWFDRDSDGVSDRGEVVPVEALGIVALATRATERIGASLGNPGGLELADGRILPTYDWVLESLP